MKYILYCCFILLSLSGFSQDVSTIFTNESIVYYGLDFSRAQLIGDFGSGGGEEMRDIMFPDWNNLVIKEAKKYNIGKAFRKEYVIYDLEPVTAVNSQRSTNDIRTEEEGPSITRQQIEEMVRNYIPGDKKAGTALVFIVENFNKRAQSATIHVTLFDIVSKEVLITEPMHSVPHGVSLRNYWGNAIHVVLEKIRLSKYGMWKKKYMHQK